MALTAAQLLDELMGRDRNLVPGEKSNQLQWDDEGNCSVSVSIFYSIFWTFANYRFFLFSLPEIVSLILSKKASIQSKN